MSIINVPSHDLKFYRGDTAIRTVKIWDESVKPRQLQDLSTATALMQLRATSSASSVLYTFTTTIADNIITLSIPQADWGAIDTLMASGTTSLVTEIEDGKEVTYYKIGVFDLQLTYSSGVVDTQFAGSVLIRRDVSR
ncbi:MAG: hypothetical protein ACK5U7_08225 [Bacteroidota bacterium]|jgi:hypothetical protein